MQLFYQKGLHYFFHHVILNVGKNGKKWEVGDSMFIGEYRYNLDDKGRLVIPSNFKELSGSQVIIARGLEKCLYLYSITEWEKLTSKLTALSFTKKHNREFTRLFLSGAYESEVDSKGRINIDEQLLLHANLKKECVIIGAGSRVEIWAQAEWVTYLADHQQVIEEISEELDL